MEKDPEIFLRHIQESIGEIESYTAKMLKKDFLKDRKTQDAVIRRIEIIGEAVKNLPRDFKERYLKSPGARSPACEISSFTGTLALI